MGGQLSRAANRTGKLATTPLNTSTTKTKLNSASSISSLKDMDWTERPKEDDKVLQNFKSLEFAVRTVETAIRKDTKALETLRNRLNIQQQGEVKPKSLDLPRKAIPGTLQVSQIHQILGYRRAKLDEWSVDRLAKHFSVEERLVEQLIKYYNIYETVGNGKEGFYGTWAHNVMPQINPMPSEVRVQRVLDRIKYEEKLDQPNGIDQPLWQSSEITESDSTANKSSNTR